MQQKPSWESSNRSARQEISSILRNPKFHYRVHTSGANPEPDESSPNSHNLFL
jgi:hypothetical protein